MILIAGIKGELFGTEQRKTVENKIAIQDTA